MRQYLIFLLSLLLVLNFDITKVKAEVSFDLDKIFSLFERSDKYSNDFIDFYKKSLPNSELSKAKSQVYLYKEAYFLLLDNYIYDVSDIEKDNIANKSKNAVKKSIELLKKENKPITAEAVMEFVMFDVYNNIDAHTIWMNKKMADEFRDSMTGNHKGIGILFNYDKTKKMIFVIKVFKDSPAQTSGLQKGDYIKAVDGVLITADQPLEAIIKSIRGENGTKVKLTILRDGVDKEYEIIRGDYYVPSVESKVLESNYAYVAINSFNQDTASLFRSDIAALQVNQLKGLIIDVRNNPGGLLTAVVIIADSILAGDAIVAIKGRTQNNNQSFVSFNQTQIRNDLPIIILTNSSSASASELLAGAVALNNRATIIGDNTFGKWSVQSSFTLKDKSIFNITTQLFYAPKGSTFQGEGIAPDIKIIDNMTDKSFREKNYKNYLVVKDLSKRKPKLTIKDSSCPSFDNNKVKDRVLGCAIMFLNTNADLRTFKTKIIK